MNTAVTQKRIYLIRHGSIAYDYDAQGQKLIPRQSHPLSPDGRREITVMSNALRASGARPCRIWTSPTIRALQSAQLLSQLLNVTTVLEDDNLRCIAEPPTSTEGYPKLDWECRSNIRNLPPSNEHVASISRWWQDSIHTEDMGDELIVTHGYTLRILLHLVSQDNAQATMPTLEESKIKYPIERGEGYFVSNIAPGKMSFSKISAINSL